ncbi:putative phage abortive infection protein [Methylobacterium terrae]|uniref:putative phage abortive infection protein n=1 Tax=Methylobacterium terrae TaxID=2202827 RepID=UPI0013A55039|nr:putative phage abortive infection protein [Methylobacterium terrae]
MFAIWLSWAFLRDVLKKLEISDLLPSELGPWGDSFGALTSLFTLLGFIGITTTIVLQRQQMATSEKFQRLERFDNLYFEIMKLIREVRKEVKFRYTENYAQATGHSKRETVYDTQALRFAWREISYFFNKSGKQITLAETQKIYHEIIHDRFESGFAPYFRSVFTIMRKIDEEENLSEKEKHFYANLIRSQMNSYELAVVALNALSPVAGNLKYYLTKYRMLKYLPVGSSRRLVLIPHYDEIAFQGRDEIN